jgi:hypothetical protein
LEISKVQLDQLVQLAQQAQPEKQVLPDQQVPPEIQDQPVQLVHKVPTFILQVQLQQSRNYQLKATVSMMRISSTRMEIFTFGTEHHLMMLAKSLVRKVKPAQPVQPVQLVPLALLVTLRQNHQPRPPLLLKVTHGLTL